MNLFKRLGVRVVSLLLALVLCLPAAGVSLAAAPLEDAANLIEISDILSFYSMDLQGMETSMLEEMLAEILRRDPTLYNQMIEYMFSKLDRYSHFFSKEKYDAAYPKSAPYVGVGMIADASYPYGLVIEGFVEGGAAQEAGLQVGDVVVKVDGVSVELLPYSEAVMLVRGEADSKVKLEIMRAGLEKTFSVELERRSLKVSNISYTNMGDNVGMIKIGRFDSLGDVIDFINIYNSIPYDEDIRSVIIDLRDNPGGDVSVLYNMINYMLPDIKALLFTLTSGSEHESFITTGAGKWLPNELIILVNENTASCSEMFAGSLQMHGYATVVGVQTYGKGRSQYHIPTSNGDVVVVTAFDILLPDNSTYDGEGIKPDVIVEQEYEPYPMPKLRMLDYTKAINYGTVSTRVLALKERLAALGIYPGTPDSSYDDMTRWSVSVLQKFGNLPVSGNADKETLALLKNLIEQLEEEKNVIDIQLDTALGMAKEAAKKPLAHPLKPRETPSLD